MIYPNRFRNLLEQDRFADARRRDDQCPLAASERRKKIDTPRANRIRLWIFEHDPHLRKLRSQFFEIGRFFPIFRRLTFDCQHIVEDETFLAIAGETQFAAEFLSGPQMIKLNRSPGHVNVLRHRQEIQLGITEQSERITDLIKETFGRDVGALAERGARNIEDVMMSSPGGMEMQIEISRDWKKIVEFFQLIDAQILWLSFCGGSRPRLQFLSCRRDGPS